MISSRRPGLLLLLPVLAMVKPTACFLRPVRTVLPSRHHHIATLMGCRGRSLGEIPSAMSPRRARPPCATTAAASVSATAAPAKAVSPPATTLQQRSAALTQVRDELSKRGLAAFIVPSGDPHLSEYPADHFCRRAFISGFDGSAGTAVVTPTQALLWTDGRYHLQAEQQLGPDWTLMREGQKGVPSLTAYLQEELSAQAVVGLDPTVHPVKFVQNLAQALGSKKVQVQPLNVAETNPIDLAWRTAGGRPPAPQAPVRIHPLAFAGEAVSDKVKRLSEEMAKEGADVLVAGTLDEVAWLLNIRGEDVPNCPLPVAYAVLEREGAFDSGNGGKEKSARVIVFVKDAKLGPTARAHLEKDCRAEIRPYAEIFSYLSGAHASGRKIWLDPDKSNYALLRAASMPPEKGKVTDEKVSGSTGDGAVAATGKVPSEPSLLLHPTPITLFKAVKNEAELEGMRAAHLRDGAAEVEFLAWLEKEIQTRSVSEVEIDQVLTGFRSRREKFLGVSFDTIAGSGPNGAIIHYRAMPETCGEMTKETMLLLDSGGQYEDGTTDVTRTVHFGEPTEEEKEAFTRVLQGHIGVDTAVFPEGTPGFVLDAYARRSLWQVGSDYAHGTGHGVGAALNVHEGPHGISFNFANRTPLQAGMIVSNEPGYYASGVFGIRIENLLIVVERAGLGGVGGQDPRQRKFLGFERLTYIPISKRLIKQDLLSPEEVKWVDRYHAEVWERISPLLTSSEAEAWLREATAPMVC